MQTTERWKPASRWNFQDFDNSIQYFHQRFENQSEEGAVLKGIHQDVRGQENSCSEFQRGWEVPSGGAKGRCMELWGGSSWISSRSAKMSAGIAANARWVGCEVLLLKGGAVLRSGI